MIMNKIGSKNTCSYTCHKMKRTNVKCASFNFQIDVIYTKCDVEFVHIEKINLDKSEVNAGILLRFFELKKEI